MDSNLASNKIKFNWLFEMDTNVKPQIKTNTKLKIITKLVSQNFTLDILFNNNFARKLQ